MLRWGGDIVDARESSMGGSPRLRWLVAGAAVLAMAVGSDRAGRTGPAEGATGASRARGAAVVYTRFTPPGGPWTVVWRRLSSPAETVVHVITTSKGEAMGHSGYLPSPDGRHLLIWKADADPADSKKVVTYWLVQPLPRGAAVAIGQTDGVPLLLPYWLDNRRVELSGDVTLEGDRQITIFDVDTRKLSRPLPVVRQKDVYTSGVAKWVAKTRLEAYAQRHMLPQLASLYRAANWSVQEGGMGGLPTGIRESVHGELAEPYEYLLLRPSGIPGLGRLDASPRYHRPQFACAPDRSAVAYAWLYRQPEERGPISTYRTDASGNELGRGVYARIDVHWSAPRRDRAVIVVQWPPADWAFRVPGLIGLGPGSGLPYFYSLRWSSDGRYLSVTETDKSGVRVRVFDTSGWHEVLTIPDAYNAFVVPE